MTRPLAVETRGRQCERRAFFRLSRGQEAPSLSLCRVAADRTITRGVVFHAVARNTRALGRRRDVAARRVFIEKPAGQPTVQVGREREQDRRERMRERIISRVAYVRARYVAHTGDVAWRDL